MKKVTVWLDEKYAGVLTVTAVGHTADIASATDIEYDYNIELK